MIRTGIYTIEGLIHKNLKDFIGKEKNISIVLYNELANSSLPNKEKLQELVYYRAKLEKVYKLTYQDRFVEFDGFVNNIISEHFKNLSNNLKIHDAAASDGRTSIEWYDTLEQLKINFSLTASDLNTELKLFKNRKRLVIFNSKNKLMEVVVPPFVFTSGRKESWFYLINKIISYYYFKKYKDLCTKKNHFSGFHEFILPQVYPECLLYSRLKNNFRFINHNLFDPVNGKYDIFRVMNLLHQGYFSDEENKRILQNIHSSLNVNGLFVTGSNDVIKSPVDGAIYTRTERGFVLRNRINNGSRIHKLIENFSIF
jgi:hypothetical protein